jgi:hypothetical protein
MIETFLWRSKHYLPIFDSVFGEMDLLDSAAIADWTAALHAIIMSARSCAVVSVGLHMMEDQVLQVCKIRCILLYVKGDAASPLILMGIVYCTADKSIYCILRFTIVHI